MFWEENDAPKPQAVSKALEHSSRTCFSPQQGRVGGAIPRELVTQKQGKGRAGCEYPGSGHGIILLSEEETGLAGENTHTCWTSTADSRCSPLIPIVLLKMQDPSGVNNNYLHVTEEKMKLGKLGHFPRISPLRNGSCYTKLTSVCWMKAQIYSFII